MAADVKFALERPGESGEDDAGENGEGGGKNGGRIPVRVEKGVVHYGAEPAVPLAKGTSLVVTLPRTDDQYVATLQSFNQMEVRVKFGVLCGLVMCVCKRCIFYPSPCRSPNPTPTRPPHTPHHPYKTDLHQGPRRERRHGPGARPRGHPRELAQAHPVVRSNGRDGPT